MDQKWNEFMLQNKNQIKTVVYFDPLTRKILFSINNDKNFINKELIGKSESIATNIRLNRVKLVLKTNL